MAGQAEITKILLTGASGFAGSHALRHFLLNTQAEITCPVSLDHKGRMDRVGHAVEGVRDGWRRVTVLPCDLAQPLNSHAREVIGWPGLIVNYASASHVDRSIADPGPFVANNVQLMVNLLEYARTVPGLRGFWHVSTDEVFGPSRDGEAFGEDAPHRPSNPYAASKSCQSQLGWAWWRTYSVPFAEVYCCNMLGEHQDSEKFVPLAERKIAAGERVPVHADAGGRVGSRYWQHARNVADALLYLARNVTPASYAAGDPGPSRYNVTSGDLVHNHELAYLIGDAMGEKVRLDLVDGETGRPGHDLHYGLDGSRLAALGWVPPVGFGEAVKRTVARKEA